MIKDFTDEDKEVIRGLLSEMTDEQLFELFEPVYEAIKEKLDPIKRRIRQKKNTVYSNPNWDEYRQMIEG